MISSAEGQKKKKERKKEKKEIKKEVMERGKKGGKENKKKYAPDSEPQRIAISNLHRYLESNTVQNFRTGQRT